MIGLCHIPGCRIRGRHLPTCVDDQCGGCLPRVADAGYACDHHVDSTSRNLAAVIDLTPDARLVAAGLVRRGHGGSTGKPGSRPPLNDGATDALDEVQSTLTTLARDIAETRGLSVNGNGSRARLRSPQSAAPGFPRPDGTPGAAEASSGDREGS